MKTKDKIDNQLKAYVMKRKAHMERMTGKKVLIGDILTDISRHCGFDSFDTINMIYRGVNNPSLLKIADYFDVPIERIFRLKAEE